ncbi:hypothetical protein AVEN_10120-1 [Araneus ventricosus]|uniref:Uncharacterized protein n=1 Tax=Araneus ventricosus TaxID=182803 RepID=A0A4Y2L0Z3_ARAVE|nr:hypothetical protein AVEN_10120-1 [Araneus ventricosus]
MIVKLNSNLSKREKIQVLTIAPQSWSRKRVSTKFNVTEYMARKAWDLTLEKGILTIPGSQIVNKISQEDKKTRQNGQVWILNYVFDGILLKGAESSAILQRLEPSLHNSVACVYEENWWMVSELNKEGGDYTIAFIHPHGPSETFYWLERQNECPVPSQHILGVIETPEITSHTGCLYKIVAKSKKKIDDSWNTFRESC